MNKLVSISIYTLALLVFVGCFPPEKKSRVKRDKDGKKYIDVTWGRDFSNFMKNELVVDCFGSRHCDSYGNVGRIMRVEVYEEAGGRTNWGAGECTGFLVASNIVATNSHCIPDFMKKNHNEYNCGDFIKIKFPENRIEEQRVYSCTKLISFSQNREDEPYDSDYAFFEVESSKRRPLEIVRRPVDSSIPEAKVISANSIDDGIDTNISEQNCSLFTSDVFSDHKDRRYSEDILIGECNVIPGNSGSPVTDQEGRVFAIIKASSSYGTTATIAAKFVQSLNTKAQGAYKFEVTGSRSFTGMASSLVCAPLPPGNSEPPAECNSKNHSQDSFSLSMLTHLQCDVSNRFVDFQITSFIERAFPSFLYDITIDDEAVVGHPRCYLPRSLSLFVLKGQTKSIEVLESLKGMAIMPIDEDLNLILDEVRFDIRSPFVRTWEIIHLEDQISVSSSEGEFEMEPCSTGEISKGNVAIGVTGIGAEPTLIEEILEGYLYIGEPDERAYCLSSYTQD